MTEFVSYFSLLILLVIVAVRLKVFRALMFLSSLMAGKRPNTPRKKQVEEQPKIIIVHFHLKPNAEQAAHFAKLARTLTENEERIVAELKTVQGRPVDIGGYYKGDSAKCKAIMRPSPTLNAALKAASA